MTSTSDTVARPALWPAPYAAGPVRGEVSVPGSKSITNRALLLAAVADGPSVIDRPLVARDTELMEAALLSLGVGMRREDVLRDGGSAPAHERRIRVDPHPLRGPALVDCGLAGTVMRFVPPVAALAVGDIAFDGDPRARQRPMGAVLGSLRHLGVDIEAPDPRLPFTLHGAGSVAGGIVTIDASESSQFVSALLLAGARYERGLDVRHDGKPVPSLPHIEMTVAMLRERSVDVDDSEPDRWVVRPGAVRAIDCTVEPDLSNAAPFLAAALVTGGSVTVRGWPERTRQAGDRLRELMALLGADVERVADGIRVSGRGQVNGIDVDLHDVGELAPVVAAVCAVASSPSYLRGIAHLRGHETDRLAALSAELRRLGADARETDDGLEIRPRPLSPAVFSTYHDHRMAQAGAVLGLVVDGIEVEDIATTAKTHPDFAGAWTAMLA